MDECLPDNRFTDLGLHNLELQQHAKPGKADSRATTCSVYSGAIAHAALQIAAQTACALLLAGQIGSRTCVRPAKPLAVLPILAMLTCLSAIKSGLKLPLTSSPA